MKTVEDHNEETRRSNAAASEQVRRTGVACPKCGAEMLWQDGILAFARAHVRPLPGKFSAACSSCGTVAELEVPKE